VNGLKRHAAAQPLDFVAGKRIRPLRGGVALGKN